MENKESELGSFIAAIVLMLSVVAFGMSLATIRLHNSFVRAVEDYHICEEGGLVCQIERHALDYEVIGVDEDIYYEKGE